MYIKGAREIMEIYNFSYAERTAIKNFNDCVAQISPDDKAMITLNHEEYRYVLKHLGLKEPNLIDILFGKTPKYRNIELMKRSFPR